MERLIQGLDPLQTLGIFAGAVIINFVGCYEIQKIQKNEAMAAATATSLNIIVANAMMYMFIHDTRLMIPEAVGGFLGTYLQVLRNRRR